jgi:Flp pilus assembly protein TadG
MNLLRIGANRRKGERGQSLVEFSMALIPFLFLLMAVIDLGRGIYTNNGTAQAAREIARVASVHQCTGPCTSGTWSAEILETFYAQQAILPGLNALATTIECVTIDDTPLTVDAKCPDGQFVRVTVTVTFKLVSPILPFPNPFVVSSTAHVQVP